MVNQHSNVILGVNFINSGGAAKLLTGDPGAPPTNLGSGVKFGTRAGGYNALEPSDAGNFQAWTLMLGGQYQNSSLVYAKHVFVPL